MVGFGAINKATKVAFCPGARFVKKMPNGDFSLEKLSNRSSPQKKNIFSKTS
jgi:hypothetical protein